MKQNLIVLLIASFLVIGSTGIGLSVITNGSKVGDTEDEDCCPDITVFKYHDLNEDGMWSEGEEGLEGWYFELFEKDPESEERDPWGDPIDEGETDENGYLVFEDYYPCHHYKVREYVEEGWRCTNDPEEYEFDPEWVEYSFWLSCCSKTIEFGNVEVYGDLEVCKYHDENMNGRWDEEEIGLSDWTMNLWATEDGLPTEVIGSGVTGEDGCLIWEDLEAGNYYVQEELKKGWECTNGTEYEGLIVKPVEIVPGETSYVEFGNVHLTDLKVYKYYDMNYDGIYNTKDGDYLMSGWTFTLGDMKATTGKGGYVWFDDLYPGTYTLAEEIKEGYYSTTGAEVEVEIESCMGSKEIWVGNTEYVEITIEKFNDINGNGIKDSGETLLEEEIFFNGKSSGGFFLENFGVTGEYTWSNELPGTYAISEVLEMIPEGWYPTTETIQQKTLGPGEHYVFSFGNTQYGDIIVYKFCDCDYDGEYDEEEDLIDGFTFQLWEANEDYEPIEKIGTPEGTTDGMLTFDELEPGYYVVQEIIPEDDCNWCPTTGLFHNVHVTAGQTSTTWFGNVPGCGTIEGMKFKDIMADGHFDVGLDQPLMNWEINLWTVVDGEPGDIIKTVETNRCGEYTFECICPGEYYVQEVMQDGWYAVTDELVHVEIGTQETVNVDFANCMYKEVYGIKYYDYNMNGEYDEEDWVLPGWDIILKDESGNEVMRTKTQDCGYYFFEGLTVGTYYVEEIIPKGWNNTTPASVEVEFTCCSPCEVINFGNYEYPDITIYKFHDYNMDGNWDATEPLVDETVPFNGYGAGGFFYENFGVIGQHTFIDVEVGDYTIIENLPTGWEATTPLEQYGTLNPGDHWEVYFGNVKYGNITTCKFYDENMNSEWDDGEEMLPGWEFNLWTTDEDGSPEDLIRTNETGECGCYTFEDLLPGLYAVQEIEQDCWFPTTDLIQYVEIEAGETGEAWFGNVPGGSIDGYKFCDYNMNLEFDEIEYGLEGWTINLYTYEENEETTMDGHLYMSTVTDEDGYYEFECIEPGMYVIEEEMQEDWYASTPESYIVEVEPEDELSYDFGNYRYGDITGIKFYDFDMNGEFESGVGDIPLRGRTVELWEADVQGNKIGTDPIDSTETDEHGYYLFEDVGPGDYVVYQPKPCCDWEHTTPREVHVRMGCLEEREVNFGEYTLSSIDVYVTGETGVDVKIYESDEDGVEGDVIESGVTGDHGWYISEDLEPGYYLVKIEGGQTELVQLRMGEQVEFEYEYTSQNPSFEEAIYARFERK